MVVALVSALALVFPHGTATLTRADGSALTLRVEIAETAAQHARGLMYRRQLRPRSGMAFVFPTDTRGSFWMQNTRIPLSIAFYDANRTILRILRMAPCLTSRCRLYDPHVAFRGALEVNRGAFRRWGVRRGDRVTLTRDG